MAELVATMVIGPLLAMVKEKASNYLLDQYQVMEGMEEQHEILMRKLPAILDVITDAEQVAAHREGAKAWLGAIKKVAYEANEVFDEFKYEALRRHAREKGHYADLGFHVIKLFPTHNRFVFRLTMANKLRRIVQAVEVLVTEMNTFGFQYKQQAPPSKQWLRQTDHVMFDPHKIISISRGRDSKNIVDILRGQDSNLALTVVPIVGMGGLGKTTLAQLVFNDPKIHKHFELLLWVCVSDSFDVDSLANAIVEAAPKKQKGYTEADTKKGDTVQADFKKSALESLRKTVSGQRYLLVLDDVWNRESDKWEKLKASLQYGGKGSAILTTTRDEGVASIMGTVQSYNLTALEDKFIREIIEARAFSLQKEEERSAVLVKMVGEIVKRCAGSPLAATALGSVLRTKTSEEEWKAVLSISNICTEESGILPILKLNYNDLPLHMKQCFAYCALFPKDYVIDVEKLIQLWIANGFIREQMGVQLETIGKHIFNELAARSFFQDVKLVQVPVYVYQRRGGCYSRYTCKIHDLMHDVALSIMEKECAIAADDPSQSAFVVAATLESSHIKCLTNTTRHLFLACKEPGNKLNVSMNKTSPAIQTLLCDTFLERQLQHLLKYSSLRALQLRTGSFPLRPKDLRLLRYLDLSRSYIQALPEDISVLYNLQTLDLSDCYRLDRLPRQMKYMTALCHLYTHGCPELKSMPPGLGKLISLQTLTCFVAGTGSGCSNVRELKDLDLAGELELCHLENVTKEDAKAANLRKKKGLKELTLKWSIGCEEDAKVLEGLEPHDEQLQAIRIASYGGTAFPKWMMVVLPKMADIHLFHCKKLECLFSRDTPFTFSNLKELTLEDLPNLQRLCETSSGGAGEVVIFPRLAKLIINRCGKLTTLPGRPVFPNLQNAHIKKCPLLRTQLEAPNLGVLDMQGREEEVFMWVARHMASLTDLKLECGDIHDLAVAKHSLSQVVHSREKWSRDHKIPLATMELFGLKSGVAELCACFIQLQDLTITDCDGLVHWPEKELEGLVSLRRLVIGSCVKLTGYASTTSCDSERSDRLLPSLESLTIMYCYSLLEVFNVPASLKTMTISNCSMVESIFGRRWQQQQEEEEEVKSAPSSIVQLQPFVPAEVSSSSLVSGAASMAEHILLPCLESLEIVRCDNFTGRLDLPPSLKELEIRNCNRLRSLDSRPGALLSLEQLGLHGCKTLSSLPDAPQAYSSLGSLTVVNCPGIKTLPHCLKQRLGSLKHKDLDARYEGVLQFLNFLQLSWKFLVQVKANATVFFFRLCVN